jgi:predicted transcriptional regulator
MTLKPGLVTQEEEGVGCVADLAPSFKTDDFFRVKNATLLLGTLEERGSNTRNKTIINTFNTSNWRYAAVIEDLIGVGAIDNMVLRGDRTWISITDKGRRILRNWRRFIASFNGGT